MNSLAIDGRCRQIHLPHATFSHVQSLHRSRSANARVHWLKFELCLPKIGHSSTRHVSPCASQHTEHQHKFSLSPTSPVLLSSSSPNPDLLSAHPFIHCEDPRQDGTSTEFHSSTGYEPKRTELNTIVVNPQNQTTDDQDDIEEIGVKPLSYSQSLIRSAYDSAESIAAPPDSDLEDEQLRKMLASPLYIREREENQGQVGAYH